MIPHVQGAIQSLSQRILSNVLPNIGSTYVMSDTAMLAMLLSALGEEAESGIAKRLQDIESMRLIFQQASSGFDVPEACLEAEPIALTEMTLTVVNQQHDDFTAALIELQTRAEERGAAELNMAIWQYLSETHERHALPI